MKQLDQLLHAMLTENTGRHMLDSGTNPDVQLLADQIISAQQAEIDQMRAMLAE